MILTRLKTHHQSGATIVEVLVAIALTGIFLPVLATALMAASAGKASSAQQIQAQGLIREATDAVRSVREKGWSNVSTDGTYHPTISGSAWALSSGSETIGNYTRQIDVTSTHRNDAGAIVSTGGTADPSTKHVVVTVSWSRPAASSLSSDTYLTRWQSNAIWSQTTQADFDGGIFGKTLSTNTSGGEVRLDTTAGTSWASNSQIGSLDISGTTNATDVYVDSSTNRAYVVNGTGLSVIDISNPAAPTLLGTFNPALIINSVYVSGNYAYLASSSNTAEFTVVDVSNPAAPTQVGAINLNGTADGLSIYVSGTYAYLGQALSATNGNNEFYVIDVSTPTSPTISGSLNLNGSVNGVAVSGDYAYLATSDTAAELTVVNVSNPATPTVAGTYDSTGAVAANDVFADGTFVYLGLASDLTGAEFFVLDASNPTSVTQVGSYEAGGAVSGIYVADNKAFLATAVTAAQFTVLDLSDPANPTLEGKASLTTESDVFVSNDVAYIASTSNTAELTVMGGISSGMNWAIPSQAGNLDLSGTTAANDVAVDAGTNRAYVVNGTGLSIIDVSSPGAPTLLGTFTAGVLITNVKVSGNYAYLASSSNTAELTVVNVSNPAAPTQAGTLNLGGNADANTLDLDGSYAYVGKTLSTTAGDNEFYVVNVSNPAAPTLAGAFNLSDGVFSVKVSGNYAYLATAIDTAELTVIDISNKTAPSQAGTFDTAGIANGTEIFLANGYAYLAELNNTAGGELFILDISNPGSVSQLGSYENAGNINSITVSGNYAYLATARAGQQFLLVNVSNPAAPVRFSSATQSTNNSITFANNTAYLASTNTASEFIIMQPSNLSGAPIHGTYESPTFDAGKTVGFNRLSFTASVPSKTTLYFRVATNTDASTWNYVGPDGTSNSKFTADGPIPFIASQGRYIRYKVWFNTLDNLNSPVVSDVTVNYSP
jgi:Tfp pilus assembly protein PilV